MSKVDYAVNGRNYKMVEYVTCHTCDCRQEPKDCPPNCWKIFPKNQFKLVVGKNRDIEKASQLAVAGICATLLTLTVLVCLAHRGCEMLKGVIVFDKQEERK